MASGLTRYRVGGAWYDAGAMGSLAAELFRYHVWANRRLIGFCAGLDEAQLAQRSPRAYGSIRETLAHMVGAEGAFTKWVTGEWVDPPLEPGSSPTLAELAERAERTGAALVEAAERTPGDGVLSGPRRGVTTELPAGALFAQVLYHAGEHRAQVVAMLAEAGVRPPDLSGWRFGGDRSGDYEE
jgi:uncharacterized damage-inducible protein DinB